MSADQIFVILIVLASVIGLVVAESRSRRRQKAADSESKQRKSA